MKRPPQLPPDKANHWIKNSIAMIVAIPFLGLYLAYIFGVLLSIAIEFYQKWTKTGKFEWLDALAGSAGCTSILVGCLLDRYTSWWTQELLSTIGSWIS